MIEVANLTKKFGIRGAVDSLSFTVEKGEVLGFLGPNGAGKSTTMRMITGFAPPSSGAVRVCGYNVEQDPETVKTKIGYLPESAPLYSDMSFIGLLKFCANVRGIKGQRKLIRELGATKSVLFSTHILEEVDAACSRVVIVDQGKIVKTEVLKAC